MSTEAFQSGTYVVVNMYASFTSSNDRVLSVFASNIYTNNPTGFIQSAGNPFWHAGNTQNKSSADDSWVNIGTNPNGSGNAGGNGGVVVGDPNFVNFTDANDSTDYSFIESVGNGAGWYNGNPANTYGYAIEPGQRVLLAHFVIQEPQIGQLIHWDARLTVFLNGATGSQAIDPGPLDFTWIPAPSALPAVAAVGLLRGRRRMR